MKKKTTTYILLVIVVAIWGLIIYKLVAPSSSDEIVFQEKTVTQEFEQKESYDTIVLALNYRDPFLKTVSVRAKTVVKPKVQQKQEVVIPQRVIWPQIRYEGIISSKGSKLAMIQINRQSYILEIAKEEQGVIVKKTYQDSILLQYKHEEKYFYKN